MQNSEKLWIQRNRKINSTVFFKLLIESFSRNIGISSLIKEQSNFCVSAIHKFRSKIPFNYFKSLNENIHALSNMKNHIYCIDGSKVHVKSGFKKLGYKSRTNDKLVSRNAKRPICMLSALVGLQTDTIKDFTITKHFNERKCVLEHFNVLNPCDVVIMDRGYYSKELYSNFYEQNIHCIMRLKCDANKFVKEFYKSNFTNQISSLIVNDKIITIRYVKYFIENKKYVLATTMLNTSKEYLKKLYGMRWRVELSFKRLKSYLQLEKNFSILEKNWLQEFEAKVLVDTITRQSQLEHERKKDFCSTIASVNPNPGFKKTIVWISLLFLNNLNK